MDKETDFSSIVIKLITSDGLIKEKTECTPTGYYILPIYDKGSYKLTIEGPDGWSFEPNHYDIKINEGDTECMGGKDLNFAFTGFSLSGSVAGKGCQNGPSDVKITLQGEQENRSTFTDKDGKYLFENVLPSNYLLTASHPSWTFENGDIEIEMKWDNTRVEEKFTIKGFNIKGEIISEKKEALSGVEFHLFDNSKHGSDVESNALKIITSNDRGLFEFKEIECGMYRIVPFYKQKSTVFKISPEKVDINILNKDFTISSPFSIVGFTALGKVLTPTDPPLPIPNAKIYVDDEFRAETNDKGDFYVYLNTGEYTIKAKKDNYEFSELKNYRVSSDEPNLPHILSKKYSVCGKVSIENNSKKEGRKVTLFSSSNPNSPLSSSLTNQNGEYCFSLEKGSYIVHVSISQKEKDEGIELVPSSAKVEVVSAPQMKVNFSQLRVTISGSVKCLEECHPSISVKLTSLSKETRLTTGLGGINENRFTEKFVFADVLPGKYQINIEKDDFCWQSTSFVIEATTQGHQEISFVQSGYYFKCSSKHEMELEYSLNSTSPSSSSSSFTTASTTTTTTIGGENIKKVVSLKKGENKICLPKAGKYEMKPISCYQFQQSQYSYHTSSPSLLSFTPSFFQLVGKLYVTSPPSPSSSGNENAFNPPPNINIDFLSPSFNFTVKKEGVSKREEEYKVWVPYSLSSLSIVPKEADGKHLLLFYPPSLQLPLRNDVCPFQVSTIQARKGLLFEGHVTPSSVKQVLINVYNEKDNSLVASTITKEDGSYSLGPFYDTEKYRLEAKKEGYSFVEMEENVFKVIKLCSVTVHVHDKENGEGIEGAILSLTSTSTTKSLSYRSNNRTLPSGSFSFKNLLPSSYFLKPIYKEYSFLPSSSSFTLSSGEDLTLSINATRIAYSCFGKLSYLNKKPHSDSHLSASSFSLLPQKDKKEEHYEETNCNSLGECRIRGLKPKQNYLIKVKEDESNDPTERTVPPFYKVTDMPSSDLLNKNFIVFKKHSKYDITGKVDLSKLNVTDIKFKTQVLNSLSISLFTESANKERTLVSKQFFNHTNFFDFIELSKGKYILKLESSLDQNAYDFKECDSEKIVDLENLEEISKTEIFPNRFFLSFLFNPKLIVFHQQPTTDSVFGFTFIFFFAIAFYYRVPLLAFYYSLLQNHKKGTLKPFLISKLKNPLSFSSSPSINVSPQQDFSFIPKNIEKNYSKNRKN